MKYKLSDSRGNVIALHMDAGCDECEHQLDSGSIQTLRCPTTGKRARIGRIKSPVWGTVLVCSFFEDDLNSKRVFQSKLRGFLAALSYLRTIRSTIDDSARKRTMRLIHSLISLNAHNIQEIYNMVSQEQLTGRLSDQVGYIAGVVKGAPAKTARLLLNLAKNNLAMKTEFSALARSEGSGTAVKPHLHPIHKVLLNVLHVFFADFADKGVHVQVAPTDLKVVLDYELFHVALYDIMDNAVKYVMPNSSITIDMGLVEGELNIVVDMMSLQIHDEEVQRLCEEGYSGKVPKSLGIAGHGLGMYRAAQFLERNDASLVMRNNIDRAAARDELCGRFERNQFVIILRSGQIRKRFL